MKYYVRTTLERNLHSSYNQIEYELLVDREHKPVESFIDQLEYISDNNAVLLEDDCILCKDFKNKIEQIIEEHKDTIINFFYYPYDYFTSYKAQRFLWNQCTYYPKGISKLLADKMKELHNYACYPKQYDQLEEIAIKKLNLLVYFPRPCLVQHIDYNSLIQPKYVSGRRSIYFIDYLNELNIKYEDAYTEENKKKLKKLMDEKFKNKLF